MLLNEMEIFYYVVELKSFSKAAEKLEVTKSHISKKITLLEQALDTQLLIRSTLKITMTEAGEIFFKRCAQVVSEAEHGFSQVKHLKDKPKGRLRISAPPALGDYLLPNLLEQYMSLYPEVILEIYLDNRILDLVAEGIDLAIRAGKLDNSNLVATKLFTVNNNLYATPQYIKKYGIIRQPEQLIKHPIAVYKHKAIPKTLTLLQNKKEIITPIKPIFSCNQLALIKQVVLNHHCAAALPEFMVEEEIKNKRLINILENHSICSSDVYAVYPNREFLPSKVRIIINMLKQLKL